MLNRHWSLTYKSHFPIYNSLDVLSLPYSFLSIDSTWFFPGKNRVVTGADPSGQAWIRYTQGSKQEKICRFYILKCKTLWSQKGVRKFFYTSCLQFSNLKLNTLWIVEVTKGKKKQLMTQLTGRKINLQNTILWPRPMKSDKLCIYILINLHQTWRMKLFIPQHDVVTDKEFCCYRPRSRHLRNCLWNIHNTSPYSSSTQLWLPILQVLKSQWETLGQTIRRQTVSMSATAANPG